VKVFISVGEPSGDLHASALIRALKFHEKIDIYGISGPGMQQEGCLPVAEMDELNVMGIGDVIKALPRIRRVKKRVVDWCEENHPDLVILIDFPGFHMRLGKALREMGIPVLYYIAPKLWAWGAWRVKKLAAAQDRLASILPFEPKWFAKHGIDAEYVGNPSVASSQMGWSASELKQRLGIDQQTPLVAFLPGSRPGELERHAVILAESFRALKNEFPHIAGVTTRAPGISDEQLQPLIDAGLQVIIRDEKGYAMRADVAVAVSGTATLELALWNVPSVLVYRNSPTMVFLARKLVQTTCAGLANIVLDDRPVMPELIQENVTIDRILAELRLLISDKSARRKQQDAFAELRNRFGEHDPSKKVAQMALGMLKENK